MAVLDTLRIIDHAILTWLRDKVSTKYTGLDRDLGGYTVFSSPERPYGMGISPQERAIEETDPRLSKILTDTDRMVQTAQTPIISLQRLSLGYSSRRNNTFPFRWVRPWDKEYDWFVYAEHPKPWDIPYQIDVKCRFRDDANRAIRFFLHYPNPVVTIRQVDFGYPWGDLSIDLIFSGIVDNSDLEPMMQERWIRYTIDFIAEGWLVESFQSDQDVPFNRPVGPESNEVKPVHATRKVRVVKSIRQDYALLDKNCNQIPVGGNLDRLIGPNELLAKIESAKGTSCSDP